MKFRRALLLMLLLACGAVQAQQLALWIGRIASFRPPGLIDEAALYGDNLVSGMIRADA